MTLSPLDDFPFHQVAESLAHVGTGDRNFYDRYYFNGHASSDEAFFVFGLGQYPNLGVTDSFFAVLTDQHHRVVRASRELGLDRRDTAVGPLRVEVLEPLRRLRVLCEPNEWGLAADLMWEGAIAAHAEPPHFQRSATGRVVFDTKRLAQTGRWTGSITVGGREIEVAPDRWWGSRDRSWGVRPVGEPEPSGIGAEHPLEGYYWIYAPMQFEEFSLLCILQEEPDGTRVLEQAVRVWSDPDRPAEALGRPAVELRFAPGGEERRDVVGATVHLTEPSGEAFMVAVEILLPMHVGVGTGYGFDADWRHGMWQGPLVVQGVSYDLRDPDVREGMWGIVDAVARFEVDGGRCSGAVGHGLFETLLLGRHDPSGLT